jgi:hypothetical protein
MKVVIEFKVDWPDYNDVYDQLIIEDMFENWPGKEGVEIKKYKIYDRKLH